jgi:hypothetical protein
MGADPRLESWLSPIRLSQRRGNRGKFGVEPRAGVSKRRDYDDRNLRRDQTVFDCRRTSFVFHEAPD